MYIIQLDTRRITVKSDYNNKMYEHRINDIKIALDVLSNEIDIESLNTNNSRAINKELLSTSVKLNKCVYLLDKILSQLLNRLLVRQQPIVSTNFLSTLDKENNMLLNINGNTYTITELPGTRYCAEDSDGYVIHCGLNFIELLSDILSI